MKLFRNLSLKNKIFISCLGFILLVSLVIGLFTRWLLISSLTNELKKRGVGISQSIADSSRVFMLTKDRAELTAIAFDAKQGNRQDIILYILIKDSAETLLAHTFTSEFPAELNQALQQLSSGKPSITLMDIDGHSVFNISEPVMEGIYTIGSVHVGLDKQHIERLIRKLRMLFFSFLSAVTILFFIMSHWLARYITRPVSALTNYIDQIRMGNYETIPLETPEILDNTQFMGNDELKGLTDSFITMTAGIRISRMKLEESEEKYRSLFTSGPNPIFVIDQETFTIIAANPMAVEVYGYDTDELINKPFSKLGSLGSSDFSKTPSVELGSMIAAKVKFYTKTGEALYMNVHTNQAKYKGKNTFIVATANITELVEKDSQLIQASKMTNLEKMSAGIAHELNQPLNAIKMGSEFLLMMAEKGSDIKEDNLIEVTQVISSQVTRASEIINRLRKFSKKADFSRDLVSINTCILAVNKIVGRQLKLQNIDLRLSLDQSLPPVLAQSNRLEQVIFNLVTNARDAIIFKLEQEDIPAGGIIEISSFHASDSVVITVSDNGSGIPDSDKEKIFETFYTTKEMGEGMGLGLPIIHGIVKDFNGQIRFETQQGKGSCFRISLPSLMVKPAE